MLPGKVSLYEDNAFRMISFMLLHVADSCIREYSMKLFLPGIIYWKHGMQDIQKLTNPVKLTLEAVKLIYQVKLKLEVKS